MWGLVHPLGYCELLQASWVKYNDFRVPYRPTNDMITSTANFRHHWLTRIFQQREFYRCHMTIMATQTNGNLIVCSKAFQKVLRSEQSGLCEGNPPVSSGFPSQRPRNVEGVSMSWHHHDMLTYWGQDKMADISQMTFLNAFLEWKCMNFN